MTKQIKYYLDYDSDDGKSFVVITQKSNTHPNELRIVTDYMSVMVDLSKKDVEALIKGFTEALTEEF